MAKKWTGKVGTHSPAKIARCVADQRWQKFRKELKGLSTEEKLTKLKGWQNRRGGGACTKTQVDNYINALKRGGQLNADLEVVK